MPVSPAAASAGEASTTAIAHSSRVFLNAFVAMVRNGKQAVPPAHGVTRNAPVRDEGEAGLPEAGGVEDRF
jgi:hypothetical protein